MNTRSVLECGGPPPLYAADKSERRQRSLSRAEGFLYLRSLRGLLCRLSAVPFARPLARPKAWRLALAAFFLLPSAIGLRAWGQYSLDWCTVDGGGGTSTGGVYTVSGTIGQPDAGAMTGGNYTLSGGFWGIIAAVQTPGAPYVWVMRTETNTVCVWWAVSATSWQLEATTSLVTGGSVWSGCSYVTNGANCVHVESPPLGNKFYRLKQ